MLYGFGPTPLPAARRLAAVSDTCNTPWFAPRPNVNEVGIAGYQNAPPSLGMANPPRNPKVRRELLAYLEANGIQAPEAMPLPPVMPRRNSGAARGAAEAAASAVVDPRSPGARRKRPPRATPTAQPSAFGLGQSASLPALGKGGRAAPQRDGSGRSTPVARQRREGPGPDQQREHRGAAKRAQSGVPISRRDDLCPEVREVSDDFEIRHRLSNPARTALHENFKASLRRANTEMEMEIDTEAAEAHWKKHGCTAEERAAEKRAAETPRDSNHMKGALFEALFGDRRPSKKGVSVGSPTNRNNPNLLLGDEPVKKKEDVIIDAFERLEALNSKPLQPKQALRPTRLLKVTNQAEVDHIVAKLREKTRHVKLSDAKTGYRCLSLTTTEAEPPARE